MPCYDPPLPWEGKQKKNSETAVRLLCERVSRDLAVGTDNTADTLRWYLEHRQIDLEIEETGYYGKGRPGSARATEIRAEIERVQVLLANAEAQGKNRQ